MTLLHRFKQDISVVEVPQRFNNPFYYSPHSLCAIAANEVRDMLSCEKTLADDAAQGKMFGVLIVRDGDGTIGYLAAFSGLLAGRNKVDGFVPPIFDLQSPDGYFKCEENGISALNRKIKEAECSDEYVKAIAAVGDLKREMASQLTAMRDDMRSSKQKRDAMRAVGGLTPDAEAALVRESQFQKAELKRATAKWQHRIAECEAVVVPLKNSVVAMKEERKQRSAALQRWLFEQFKVLNANGQEKSLLAIFSEYSGIVPPGGAGECAAPKLLQYAYMNSFAPVAIAEFWVGASPQGEVRRDGCYYGACKSKCEPILGFMLQGLDVEENALERGGDIGSIDIVFEDEHIIVVDKPSGVLSVPGIMGGMSVQQWLRDEYLHSNELFVVHRLDMATSGLLVAAKSMDAYKELQRQFAGREVKKQYTAILDGMPQKSEGIIELPLAADYDNRPRQKVDYTAGKSAVTRYKVVDTLLYNGRRCAVVCFEPVTGRTHQLRVHAAHSGGLDCPIVGDALYGTPGERLMLHASRISFIHPVGKEPVMLESNSTAFYV
ncbi:MAG: RluA family pseudouridine synthase [Bacteroidaceae bacterium]|nr:RluA family pseudouridine synthase [Bacteroidaceae bacterium]